MIQQDSKAASYRAEIIEQAIATYGGAPDFPWQKWPAYAVLRHEDTRKWYALFMNVPRERLGLDGEGEVDVMNVKCDPSLVDTLRRTKGFLPAYHMNRKNWLTVLLDGTVDTDTLLSLLDESFTLTEWNRGEGCF